MNCPECRAALQPLRGPDGYAVLAVLATDARGQLLPGRPREHLRRVLATVYACPACEYAAAGRPEMTGKTEGS